MEKTIVFTKKDGVGKITLNRPDAFNSFTKEMSLEMQSALHSCAEDDEIRSVYITGTGKAFCAGQDLKEAIDPDRFEGFEKVVSQYYNKIALQIYNLEKPVIAAVNGVAAGAGANIALVCDIVLASESASFIQAFSKIGLIPDSGGTYVLPRLVGFQKAIALAMLGDKVTAAEAERMGMIYKYYPTEEFQEASWAIAKKLAKMPTLGLAYTKKLFNSGLCTSFQEQLDLECKYQTMAGDSADYAEGISAFVEKRKPNFTGK